jgi:ribosome recycling factor
MSSNMSEAASDAVQNHRLDVLEKRVDRHDEMMQALTESQIRTDEQYQALAAVQETTQEMISGIGKSLIKWMMGIGTALVTAVMGGQVIF